MTLITIVDVELIFAAALAVSDDQRDKFFRDCLDLLRARRHVTAADVREAIVEANRLRGRRAA
jgi:hypothetical protein